MNMTPTAFPDTAMPNARPRSRTNQLATPAIAAVFSTPMSISRALL
jgi:hypothetical protein